VAPFRAPVRLVLVGDRLREVAEKVIQIAVCKINFANDVFDLLALGAGRRGNVTDHDFGVDDVEVPGAVGLFKNFGADILLGKKAVEVCAGFEKLAPGFLLAVVVRHVVKLYEAASFVQLYFSPFSKSAISPLFLWGQIAKLFFVELLSLETGPPDCKGTRPSRGRFLHGRTQGTVVVWASPCG